MVDKTAIRQRPSKWRKVNANGRDWYIPVGTENAADWFKGVADEIHVSDPDAKGPNSIRGYGGSTLKFTMEDGTVDEVPGPWHTNSKAFFDATGLNISDLHYTFVTISTERGPGLMNPGGEIIYQDPGFVLGPFMRGERLAHQLADVHNREVYVVRESMGGSSAQMIQPNTKMHPLARRAEDE